MTSEKFAQIVAQYEKLVFTICYQMVRDYHEAQNLSQETFLSAYLHIDNCPCESYKPWLARIATNKAKDYLKSAYYRRVSICEEEQLEAVPAAQTPDGVFLESESQELIQAKIHSLREPYRKVSEAYFLQEQSIDEISQLLQRPKKTVQTQIYRSRLLLQELLKEEKQK